MCQTPCGVTVISKDVLLHSCENYAQVESTLSGLIWMELPMACVAWRGLSAYELPGNETLMKENAGRPNERIRRWAGWAECDLRRIQFHAGEESWRKAQDTSFAHELIHIAQFCTTPLPVDKGRDQDHSNWDRDGFYDAIHSISDIP